MHQIITGRELKLKGKKENDELFKLLARGLGLFQVLAFFRLGLATFVNQINLGEIGPNLHQRSRFEGI